MNELERLREENAFLREENEKYMNKFIELLCTESPEQKIIEALRKENADLKFTLLGLKDRLTFQQQQIDKGLERGRYGGTMLLQ